MRNKKEIEKKEIYQKYQQYAKNAQLMQFNVKKKKEKLDLIRQKNNYMKFLICKLIADGK